MFQTLVRVRVFWIFCYKTHPMTRLVTLNESTDGVYITRLNIRISERKKEKKVARNDYAGLSTVEFTIEFSLDTMYGAFCP